MQRFALTAAGIAAAAVVGAAGADVTISFDTGSDPAGFPGLSAIAIGPLSGVFTAIDIQANFHDSASSAVFASDLLVALSDGVGFGHEWGGRDASLGFADGGAFGWGGPAYGSRSAFFSGYSMPATDAYLYIANGWSDSPGGSWSGTITLYGMIAVPAPGALGLLGLAACAGRDRRARSRDVTSHRSSARAAGAQSTRPRCVPVS